MSQTDPDPILPDIPKGFSLPFYYGAFTNLGVDFLVPKAKAEQLLKDCAPHAALSVADFEGRACLSLNFQVYYGQFGGGAGVTQEVEFNIVAYPTAVAARIPKLSYERYAMGEEQAGNLGFCRYRVACDSEPAIDAGVELFGEPKFRADFRTAIPVPDHHRGQGDRLVRDLGGGVLDAPGEEATGEGPQANGGGAEAGDTGAVPQTERGSAEPPRQNGQHHPVHRVRRQRKGRVGEGTRGTAQRLPSLSVVRPVDGTGKNDL